MMPLAATPMDATGTPGLSIDRLTLTNFRSYAALRLDLAELAGMPVVLVGPNGAGKTNLLEAVSYLAPGRGLRGAKLGDVTRLGAPGGWGVHARLRDGEQVVEIGTGLTGEMNGQADEVAAARRLVRIDKDTTTGPAALAQYVAMLWLTPAMDRLLGDAASDRRQFLDRMVLSLHSEHGRQLAGFERAMRERNRILGERGGFADPTWLSALEARMAEHGVAMAAARREAITRLDRRVAEEPDGPFPRPRLTMEGTLEEALVRMSALEVEDDYRERLKDLRPRDAAAGRALDGPHRSDLAAYHAASGMPARLCSTGEQKGLVIAMVLAHAALIAERTGRAPVLLLDEVAAHLDPERRSSLLARLESLRCQAWLTGTEAGLFSPLAGRAAAFAVANASLTPIDLDDI